MNELFTNRYIIEGPFWSFFPMRPQSLGFRSLLLLKFQILNGALQSVNFIQFYINSLQVIKPKPRRHANVIALPMGTQQLPIFQVNCIVKQRGQHLSPLCLGSQSLTCDQYPLKYWDIYSKSRINVPATSGIKRYTLRIAAGYATTVLATLLAIRLYTMNHFESGTT